MSIVASILSLICLGGAGHIAPEAETVRDTVIAPEAETPALHGVRLKKDMR